jgi:hypothetical protein
MTSASTLPKDVIAVGRGSKLSVLGYLTWFSVPDRPVAIKKLRKEWLMAPLDPKCLPPEPRALYLFKRAMREQEGKVRLPDGTVIETDVKDVLEDGDFCIYQISRVVRDADNREVDYPKAMRVIYTKKSEEMKFDPLGEVPRKDLLPMMEAISDYFENGAGQVDGRKVRTLVRNFLKDDSDEQGGVVGLSGENLRGKGGGVYFVAAKYKDELDALELALAGLYEDGAAYLHKVPLADTTSERELIRRHHLNNTKHEIGEAMADVAKLLREDRKHAIRSDVAAHHWRRLRALQRRAAEYKGLLKDENEDIDTATELLQKQLDKLPTA